MRKRRHILRTTCALDPGTVRFVPRVSAFHGLIIAMYYEEHGLPHFHVRYAEHDASIELDEFVILQGSLPAKKLSLVREWAALHRDELRINWERARDERPLIAIDPLP